MAFRDDQEAALARAEALDREVKRLEEENANLRREREAAAAEMERARAAAERDDEARRELQRLAARAKPAPQPSAPRSKRAPRDDAARKRQHRLRLAFTPLWVDIVFLVVGFVVAAAIYLLVANALVAIGIPFPPLVLPFMMAGMAGLFWLYHRVAHRCVRSTERWLHELPFSIDPERYLYRMSEIFEKQLVVQVELAEVGAEMALLERAVVGGMPGTTVVTDGRTLTVTSPELKIHYTSKGGGVSHNARPHRWFQKLVKRVLVPIGQSHRIREVRFPLFAPRTR